MKSGVILDTGPLVALLNRRDGAHAWVLAQMEDIKPPFITCESVLAEASYLVSGIAGARLAIIEMLRDGFIQIGLRADEQAVSIASMIERYTSVPMSLADACLVRLAELNPNSLVFTLDSDFSVYRKNGRQVIARITR